MSEDERWIVVTASAIIVVKFIWDIISFGIVIIASKP